ncbi:hypothetical protein KAR91_25740 [Candidatus Pacearchaeota archaeon]|nr:hypothetical protein [Candidatus Pacearchaeota archaeon]
MKQSWHIVNKQSGKIIFDSDSFKMVNSLCRFLVDIKMDEFFKVETLQPFRYIRLPYLRCMGVVELADFNS